MHKVMIVVRLDRSDDDRPWDPTEWPRYAAWTIAIAAGSALVTELVKWGVEALKERAKKPYE